MSRARKARGVLSIAFLVVFAAWIWLEPNRSESPVIALATVVLALVLGLGAWPVHRRVIGWPWLAYWLGIVIVPVAVLTRISPGPWDAARYVFTLFAIVGVAAIWLGPVNPRTRKPRTGARSP